MRLVANDDSVRVGGAAGADNAAGSKGRVVGIPRDEEARLA